MSGNALGGGEWTGPPGCHPGRQSERLKGGEGARDSHVIGLPHFEMNEYCLESEASG